MMFRIKQSQGGDSYVLTVAIATVMLCVNYSCFAQSSTGQVGQSQIPPVTVIANPPQSNTTVLRISKAKRALAVPKSNGSQTVVPAFVIQNASPTLTLSDTIASAVPGASINDDNSLRIRGADDQFSTYIDGVPIPLSISGSITDTLDPKDIALLHVYTGGFPAQFGGQLSGVFDITTFSGIGKPAGDVSQSIASFNTYDCEASVSGSSGPVGYFASASEKQTGFFITPPTQNVANDNGHEDHGYIKIDLNSDPSDRVSLQLGGNGSNFETPNTSDTQQETGNIASLDWAHADETGVSRISVYTRRSSLRYNGSPNDVLLEEGILDTNENQNTTYAGVRADIEKDVGSRHQIGFGFDVMKGNSDQDFVVDLPSPPGAALSDDATPRSWDVGLYAQDTWSPGRFAVNYGVRYDQNSQDITTNQVSPRVNLRYHLNGADTVHAYYDRLFQPIPVEDAVTLVGQSAVGDNGTLEPLQPERDNFYEVGIDHTTPGLTAGVAAYYKTGRDVRDDDQVGNTNIALPVDDARAYFRGVEFTLDRTFSKEVVGFANLALSWNRNAGPVTGGLNEGSLPTTYFYDDHDQTYTSSFGATYHHRRVTANFGGEYGSGQPYGEIDDASGNAIDVNYLRVPPHMTLNASVGDRIGNATSILVFADNLLNHGYIIKEVTDLSNSGWAQGRVIGTKVTEEF